ncbi:putative holin-like toxin [Paenibacillus sp. FA6]|uniref:putative holin-like toxin n=1 Tax=Paenibacillus sp. FA6 TaxID=3413029 RepID=UPI003F658B10
MTGYEALTLMIAFGLVVIDHGKLRPSKSLLDALLSMIKGKEELYMIDEQKSVAEGA